MVAYGRFGRQSSVLDPDAEAEIEVITDFVRRYRDANGIKPTPGVKFELSCLGFGEGHNLLHRQLVLTTEGDGCWGQLYDAEIRALVLSEIERYDHEFSGRFINNTGV